MRLLNSRCTFASVDEIRTQGFLHASSLYQATAVSLACFCDTFEIWKEGGGCFLSLLRTLILFESMLEGCGSSNGYPKGLSTSFGHSNTRLKQKSAQNPEGRVTKGPAQRDIRTNVPRAKTFECHQGIRSLHPLLLSSQTVRTIIDFTVGSSMGVVGSIIVKQFPEPEPIVLSHLMRGRIIAKAVPKVLLAWNRDAFRYPLLDSLLRRRYVKLFTNSRN